MQRHALPRERHQDTVFAVVLGLGGGDHRVQRGVENRRVYPESGRRHPGVAGQRHVGEDLVAAAPHSGQPLECRAVAVAARRQPLVEPVDVDRGRARWWPGAQIGAGLDGAGSHDAFGVQGPSRVRVGAGQHRHRTMARFVGAIDDHLHRHRTGCRDHQRRRQRQLVDDRAADLVAGADGHLDKARTREDDHAADRVIGQPALRPRREPAGQHNPARGRQFDHRAQQRVLAGQQSEALGIDRGVVGGQPKAASLKRIRRQLDESGAGQRGTPIHPDARHERLRHSGHQAVRLGTVFAQQRHRRHCRPRPATPRSTR